MHIPMLYGFASVETFHQETLRLTEHLNIPLNKLRRGIAKRYGFQGIAPYEEKLTQFARHDPDAVPPFQLGSGKILYVIFYETLRLSSAGFVWNTDKEAINKELASMMAFNHSVPRDENNQLLLTRIEMPWDMDEEEFTDCIDPYMDEIMLNHTGYRYPLTQPKFKQWVASHQENDTGTTGTC